MISRDLLYTALSQIPDGMSLEEVRIGYICEVLRRHGGNKTHAARALRMSRRTMYDTLRTAEHRGLFVPEQFRHTGS